LWLASRSWVAVVSAEWLACHDGVCAVSTRLVIFTIPKVYGYDLNDQNPVGCPFSIIEYIHGNTAEEVSRTYPDKYEGILVPFEEKFCTRSPRSWFSLSLSGCQKLALLFETKLTWNRLLRDHWLKQARDRMVPPPTSMRTTPWR
jgi:hypothetical protein